MLISKPTNAAKFYIYRNLHTGGFSIKYKGRVIDRAQTLKIQDVRFKVNEIGRQKVIEEQSKNVHAYAVCNKYEIINEQKIDNLVTISYNPYQSNTFFCKGKPILQADIVLFQKGKCYLMKE